MIVVNCEQRSPEWYDLHRGVLTSSSFKDIITPKKLDLSASAERVARRAVAEWLSGQVETGPTTQAMERGIVFEEQAREYFEFTVGKRVQQVGFVFLDERRSIGCSPDGLVGEDEGLEIKCPNGAAHLDILLSGTVPAEYLPQIQGCLWITGRRRWHFLSYHPTMPCEPLVVERDEKYIASLEVAVLELADRVNQMKSELLSRGYAPFDPLSVPAPIVE